MKVSHTFGLEMGRGKDDCFSPAERPKGAMDEVTTRVQQPMAALTLVMKTDEIICIAFYFLLSARAVSHPLV